MCEDLLKNHPAKVLLYYLCAIPKAIIITANLIAII